MKTIKKTVNLSQAQAKSMFKKYASNIVKALRSKGIKMIKENEYANCVDYFGWQSISEKNFEKAKIDISIYHEKTSGQYIQYVNFIIMIDYQNRCDETNLEKEMRITTENIVDIKYPLSKIGITTTVASPKTPKLNPEKEVAKQLYWALKYHNKMYDPTTKVKLKKAKERIKKFTKNEVDKIVKSFFQ